MAANTFSLSSRVTLANGLSMPQIHLGVYLTSGQETVNAVKWALEAGYRAIDSAQMYRNEAQCGRAITAFLSSSANTTGLTRKDIHFTSKLASNSSYDAARRSIRESVKKCGLEYIDLFLLHSPYGGRDKRLESWKAVEDAISDGEVRTGGVSNWSERHIEELLSTKPRTVPAVNQIEVHPFNPRSALCSFCTSHNITVQAYAPLARAMRMNHPTIAALAKKYACTPAQLMIRWSLQHGYVPLPKSVKQARIVENGTVLKTMIEKDDMAAMDGLDEGLVTDWDPLDAE